MHAPTNGDDAQVTRRLADLRSFIAEAEYLTARGWDAYGEDSQEGALLRNAGERILIKVATVAEKLPDSFRSRFPDVDWRGLARMRDLTARHSDTVNDALLWAALTSRIPNLRRQLGLDGPTEEP